MVISYWFVIIIASLFAKMAGFGDDNMVMLTFLTIVSLLYVGLMIFNSKSQKAAAKGSKQRSSDSQKKNLDSMANSKKSENIKKKKK